MKVYTTKDFFYTKTHIKVEINTNFGVNQVLKCFDYNESKWKRKKKEEGMDYLIEN